MPLPATALLQLLVACSTFLHACPAHQHYRQQAGRTRPQAGTAAVAEPRQGSEQQTFGVPASPIHCLCRIKQADSSRSIVLTLCMLPCCCPQVKAKVVRTHVDKMITLAKDGSLHARRQVGQGAAAAGAAVAGACAATEGSAGCRHWKTARGLSSISRAGSVVHGATTAAHLATSSQAAATSSTTCRWGRGHSLAAGRTHTRLLLLDGPVLTLPTCPCVSCRPLPGSMTRSWYRTCLPGLQVCVSVCAHASLSPDGQPDSQPDRQTA